MIKKTIIAAVILPFAPAFASAPECPPTEYWTCMVSFADPLDSVLPPPAGTPPRAPITAAAEGASRAAALAEVRYECLHRWSSDLYSEPCLVELRSGRASCTRLDR